MKKHEIMYILKASLDEAGIKGTIEKLHAILTDFGATIDEVVEWGLRDLAYEIKKERKGYYVIIKISSENANAINEFDRLAKINSDVLRHLIIAL